MLEEVIHHREREVKLSVESGSDYNLERAERGLPYLFLAYCAHDLFVASNNQEQVTSTLRTFADVRGDSSVVSRTLSSEVLLSYPFWRMCDYEIDIQ